MLHQDRQTFIDSELKALWPAFSWAIAVQQIWFKILATYEYNDAKNAVRRLYEDGTVNFQRQLLPAFKLAMRPFDVIKVQKQPTLAYSLKCGDKIATFFHPTEDLPPEHILMKWATKMAEKYAGLYGGDWEIIRSFESEDENPF